jgi:NADH:quinone reductase (non-electrogenic)
MSTRPRILCLGGGWVALYLVRALRRAVERHEVDLTVVSRENYHTFHGFIPEMLVGRIQPQQIASPARSIFRPAHFHNAEIKEIDLVRRRVVTGRAIDGREHVLEYDHAVLGIGSIDDLSRYPGLAEHTVRVKSFWDAFKARSHILTALEMAEMEGDAEERRRLLTFVCVGGNYGGVETASELSHYFEVLVRRDFSGLNLDEFRIVVVHSGEEILPELMDSHPRLVRYARSFLEGKGVEFRLDTRLTAATPEEAVLNDRERIPTRTILSCAGSAFSPLLNDLDFPRDERGRVLVDASGRVPGNETLWAAGDCAALPHPRGGSCPTTAIFAMMGGRHVGRNLLRHVRGQPLEPFRFTGLGEGCSIGHRRAVAHLKGIPLWGFPGWIAWRLTFMLFIPSWDRRIRLFTDWLMTAGWGRDTVNVRMNEPFGVRRELYEPGQAIVRQGDVGQRLYMIFEGEVDVVRTAPDGVEEHLATLGPGQHFGEISVFTRRRRTVTVRARSRVRLLCLGEAEALSLSNVVEPFREQVRLPAAGADAVRPEPEGEAPSP